MVMWGMLLIPLFLNMGMVPMLSAVPIADAEADPMDIYIHVLQEVGGGGSGGLPNFNNMGDQVPEVEDPEVEVPTTEAVNDLFLEGSFSLEGSSQTFKYFPGDSYLFFSEAKDICSREGLQMAEPDEKVDLTLHQYLLSEYGNLIIWVGARMADGEVYSNTKTHDFNWLSSSTGTGRTPLSSDDPAFMEYGPNANCLAIYPYDWLIEYHPGVVYVNFLCEELFAGPEGKEGAAGVLCEVIQ